MPEVKCYRMVHYVLPNPEAWPDNPNTRFSKFQISKKSPKLLPHRIPRSAPHFQQYTADVFPEHTQQDEQDAKQERYDGDC